LRLNVRDPTDLARCVAAVRAAAGVGFVAAPRRLGGVLVGSHAQDPGARLFIAAFGARDVLLAAGTLRALQAKQEQQAKWWMASCAAADAFDTAATIRSFARLPPRRRVLTLVVSAVPAAIGGWLASRLPA
jgi:hypothetical protein